VFGPNGRVLSEVFDYPVHTFSVNQNGFLSVILQMPDGYAVYVFHRNITDANRYRRYIRETINPGIFPVHSEVSPDGRYIVVGFIDVNNRLDSMIQFAFTYRGDAWGTDYGIFGGYTFEDQMLLYMRMTADNRLVAVTDAQIAVFTRREERTVEKTVTIPLHNRLEQLAFDEEGRFAVALGSGSLNAPEAEPLGTVHIYDANGTRTGSYSAGRRVTHLSMGHGMTLVGTDRNFHALNAQGEPVWEFIAGTNRAEVWRRRRTREGGDFFGIQGQE
jgi:hypothetical protein